MKFIKNYAENYIGIINGYKPLPKVFKENRRIRSLLRCVIIILTFRVAYFITYPKYTLSKLIYNIKIRWIKTFRKLPKVNYITDGDLAKTQFYIVNDKLVCIPANREDNNIHEFPEDFAI